MNGFEKILQVLSLVSSPQREAKIQDCILVTLYLVNTECTQEDLYKYIEIQYSLKLDVNEFQDGLETLKSEGKIDTNPTNNCLKLDPEAHKEIQKEWLEDEEKQKLFYNDFKDSFKKSFSETDLKSEELEKLFEHFNSYLYGCFFLYGKQSLEYFSGLKSDISDKSVASILIEVQKKIKDTKLKSHFEKYVKNFPSYLTHNQLNYLESLADRVEAFYSLGLPRDLAIEYSDYDPLNWIFYLDTNVLYSILELHDHPENEACLRIISLPIEHPEIFKYKLKYIDATKKELIHKRRELIDTIPVINYSKEQINAAIESDLLDGFKLSYLKKMLKYGDSTPHPADSLKRSVTALKGLGVEIDKGKHENIETYADDFMDKISSYKKLEDVIKAIREEKKQSVKEPRIIEKIEHDIFLREVILSLRGKKPSTLKEGRYYGLTLDKLLLSFDKNEIRKNVITSDFAFPTFFKPSFILKKIH